MRHRFRRPKLRRAALMAGLMVRLAVGLMVGVAGCVAPAPMGYMMPGPQRAGRVVVGVQAGAGGGRAASGGGAVHVEPFASAHTSLPITAAFVGGPGQSTHWYGQARFGVRHRFHQNWILGAGLTPSLAWVESSEDAGDEYIYSKGFKGNLGLDFEWAYSRRYKLFGFTFGQRLTWNAISLVTVYLTNEATFAFYGAKDAWAFTITVGLGWGIPTTPWASMALGFVFFL